MNIIFSPQRRDAELSVSKLGDSLTVNGVLFDFSLLEDGATLTYGAVQSEWILSPVERVDGILVVTLVLPHAADAPEYVRFPSDLVNPPDGQVNLPGLASQPFEQPASVGVIEWSMVVTKAMKDDALLEAKLIQAKAELAAKNTLAGEQIARIQDRIDTIGFGIDIGEATPEEEAEQAALYAPLKAWKTYKFALGKVTVQPTWYQAPVWPTEPPIPEIIAAPMLLATETI
jgi:hypothetical protein